MRAMRTAGAAALSAAVLGLLPVLGACSSDAADGSARGEAPATASAQRPPDGSPPANADPKPDPEPSGSAAPATPPASGSPAPDPGETLVRVTRSGGFAGQVHGLEVKGDGSFVRLDARAGRTGTGKLPAADLERLRTALREADFAHLPRLSTGGTVYDGYTYAVVYGGREVTADQGSLPPALEKVLAALPPFEAKAG
ncbi:hypothetical protein [Streptomyces sp. NPDC091268]|uniref:hypothetical protein n=1 Tax=Streptomyces sp. NPDC091268 TaxID=3365979 RepID=UPI0038064E8C